MKHLYTHIPTYILVKLIFVLKLVYNPQYHKFAIHVLELVCFAINQRMYIMHAAKKYRSKF